MILDGFIFLNKNLNSKLKEKKMKNLTKMIVIIPLIIVGMFFILKMQNKSNKIKIGIIQIVEHESLDKAREGFIDEMKKLGYDADFDTQIAGGDISNCVSISQKFVNDKKDLILAISTPAAQAISNCTKDIPILFTAVTDPVSCGLVDSIEKPGKNITGTSDLVPVEKQINLLKTLIPSCKKVGILYCSSEANSKLQADLASKECQKLGMSSKDFTVSNSGEIQQVVEYMINSVNAIFVPTDNLVVSCMPAVSKIANDHKIPIICSESGSVKNGALAANAMDYFELGKRTAQQADKILKKESLIQDMPVEFLSDTKLSINNDVAKKIGINIPEELK